MSTYYANDKYSAVLTSGYTVGQTTLYVSAVPNHVPTIIVAAKGTDNETIFEVTGKTTNSLTGVSRLRGANVDLDAQTPLTCLNNEEFINQLASVNAVFNEEHDETGKHTTDQINEKTEDAGVTVDSLKIKDGRVAGWDGWMPAEETWTYASATTITVPSGATTKYQKGDKIRLKQGGDYKYFYIIDVADTLLTVTGGSDYTMADAAITDNYYSKASTPQGFPTFFNWTPVVSYGGGSTDPTSNTIYEAQFYVNGSAVHFYLKSAIVRGSGNRSWVSYVLPIPYAVPKGTAFYGTESVVQTGQKAKACFSDSLNRVTMALDTAMAVDGGISIAGMYRF